MFQSLIPALIMFTITLGIVAACLLPTVVTRKPGLFRFYWTGFWALLAMIAAVSGLGQTAQLAGLPVADLTLQLQTAVSAAFVFFVMFAWFRLCGAGLVALFRRMSRRFA